MSSGPEELVVTSTVRIPFSEFEFTATRSGGPGGQNVNKVNSRIQLRWKPGNSSSLPPEALERFIKLAGKRTRGALFDKLNNEPQDTIPADIGTRGPPADVPDAMVEARAILRQAHGLAPHEPDDVQIRDDYQAGLISRREALRKRGYDDEDIAKIEKELSDQQAATGGESGRFSTQAGRTVSSTQPGSVDDET